MTFSYPALLQRHSIDMSMAIMSSNNNNNNNNNSNDNGSSSASTSTSTSTSNNNNFSTAVAATPPTLPRRAPALPTPFRLDSIESETRVMSSGSSVDTDASTSSTSPTSATSSTSATSAVGNLTSGSTTEKRRNKLGYHRTSVACGHCRHRKIRCIIQAGEPQCQNCRRLKRECCFKSVDQGSSSVTMSAGDHKSRRGHHPSMLGLKIPSSSSLSGPSRSQLGSSVSASAMTPRRSWQHSISMPTDAKFGPYPTPPMGSPAQSRSFDLSNHPIPSSWAATTATTTTTAHSPRSPEDMSGMGTWSPYSYESPVSPVYSTYAHMSSSHPSMWASAVPRDAVSSKTAATPEKTGWTTTAPSSTYPVASSSTYPVATSPFRSYGYSSSDTTTSEPSPTTSSIGFATPGRSGSSSSSSSSSTSLSGELYSTSSVDAADPVVDHHPHHHLQQQAYGASAWNMYPYSPYAITSPQTHHHHPQPLAHAMTAVGDGSDYGAQLYFGER